jgi:hypothetical protein
MITQGYGPFENDAALGSIGLRQADHAAYEAYGFDGRVVDGTWYDFFGIEERDGGREVLRGMYGELARNGDAHILVKIHLTSRVPDLTIERAARLIRNTFFHHFTNHYYCDHIAEIIVQDPANGTAHTIPFDPC